MGTPVSPVCAGQRYMGKAGSDSSRFADVPLWLETEAPASLSVPMGKITITRVSR